MKIVANKNTRTINRQKHKIEDLLLDLLELTTDELMERMKSGGASPQDISNAIRLCKENGVDIHITEGEPLEILNKHDLPFESETVVSMKDRKKASSSG